MEMGARVPPAGSLVVGHSSGAVGAMNLADAQAARVDFAAWLERPRRRPRSIGAARRGEVLASRSPFNTRTTGRASAALRGTGSAVGTLACMSGSADEDLTAVFSPRLYGTLLGPAGASLVI